MTTVTLTDEEAQAFLWFRSNEDFVLTLAAAGLDSIKGGSATIHFTPEGILQQVVLQSTVYRRPANPQKTERRQRYAKLPTVYPPSGVVAGSITG